MFWFRKNIQLGSYLALMALAIQLVVSSFHFHYGRAAPAAGGPASRFFVAGLEVSDNPAAPLTNHDPVCGLCVLLQLLAGAGSPDWPTLDLPQLAQWSPPQTAAQRLVSALLFRAFNARAPPCIWHLA